MNFLCVDVGTSCLKYQLFSDKGEILDYKAREYGLKIIDGERYVDADGIVGTLKDMIKAVAKEREFSSIAFSTIGESFVLLGKDDEVLFYPMLYTDPRGEKESEYLLDKFGKQKCFEETGLIPQSLYSVSKLLWIKNNCPEIYKKADKVLLMCDYLGYVFSGERVIDYGLAARTGAFDIKNLKFAKEFIAETGLTEDNFSRPMPAGTVVGELKQSIKDELGIKFGCKLVLGSHDQVCAALGAGVVKAGVAVDGMGTVECLTTVFDKLPTDCAMGEKGYPCIPYAIKGLYCTYLLNYSRGSTVDWLRKNIMHKYAGEESDFFAYMEKYLDETPSGVLWLPYFGGAATPYQDINAKGAIVNLDLTVTDVNLYKALLEGMAMEMRLNLEETAKYGVTCNRVVTTGGGATSDKSLKVKANVENLPLTTLRSSEGGLCGVAMLSATALGAVKDIFAAKDIFVRYDKTIRPDAVVHKEYDDAYGKYKKLYKTIKEINNL